MGYSKKPSMKIALGFFTVVLLLLLSYPVSWLGEYYVHRDKFSHSVKNYDRDGAQEGLQKLKEDYKRFVDWKLQYPADRFLFTKMHLFEASVSKLNEDFDKVLKNDLKGREGWEVSYITGVSKFMALHAAYQQAMIKKDKAKMGAILGIVLDQVRSDFEKCVKVGPGPVENFNCSFNYDLTSDPGKAAEALANPKPQIRYIVEKKGTRGKGPKKKGPEQGPQDGKDAGQGGARKVG